MYQSLARSYDPNFEPLLRAGEHVIPYMPGHQSKMRSQDTVAPLYVVTNMTPIPGFTVELSPSGAIAAATATQGASKVATKIEVTQLLQAPDNVLYQLRFHPLADFRVRVYQPLTVGMFNAQLNGGIGSIGWTGSLDPRGNPQNELFQYSNGSIGFEAINDHRVALPTAPLKMWGFAYRIAEKSVEQLILETSARDPGTGVYYDSFYKQALTKTRNVKQSADQLIVKMLADKNLRAVIATPESTFA
jgi:hypothetical protein